jgi:hypothetical protein
MFVIVNNWDGERVSLGGQESFETHAAAIEALSAHGAAHLPNVGEFVIAYTNAV